jgi:hypothetical protein
MPSVNIVTSTNLKRLVYVLVSLLLSLSPVWLRQIAISGYDPSDTMGSGGDVFAWLAWTMLAFCIAIIFQVVFFRTAKTTSRLTKIIAILASLLIWVGGMEWVHLVGVS